jgi:hypothetical protein
VCDAGRQGWNHEEENDRQGKPTVDQKHARQNNIGRRGGLIVPIAIRRNGT